MLDDSNGEMQLKIIDLESSIIIPEGLDQVILDFCKFLDSIINLFNPLANNLFYVFYPISEDLHLTYSHTCELCP